MPAAIFLKTPEIQGEAKLVMLDLNQLSAAAPVQPEWNPYPGASALVDDVRKLYPQGVDGILIGLLKVPGYRVTVGSDGIIAILIGLLLPAVQKVASGMSPDLRVLAGALGPKGQVAFAMGDGSVRIAPSTRSTPTGSPWIDSLGLDFGLGIASPRDPSSGLPTGRRL